MGRDPDKFFSIFWGTFCMVCWYLDDLVQARNSFSPTGPAVREVRRVLRTWILWPSPRKLRTRSLVEVGVGVSTVAGKGDASNVLHKSQSDPVCTVAKGLRDRSLGNACWPALLYLFRFYFKTLCGVHGHYDLSQAGCPFLLLSGGKVPGGGMAIVHCVWLFSVVQFFFRTWTFQF
jgi:hypothetical protein